MFRLAALAALATVFAATAARAADLPIRHSRLGAIFAEPAPVVRERVERSTEYETVYAPLVDIPHLVNGYYGKPKSYVYSNYYGTSPERIFERLPRVDAPRNVPDSALPQFFERKVGIEGTIFHH